MPDEKAAPTITTGLTPRERVWRALNHQEPDRVPFDLAGTEVTGIAFSTYLRLLQHLGFPEREVRVSNIVQQLAGVQEDFLTWAQVDTRALIANPPDSWQLEVLDEGHYWAYYDEWGAKLRMPKDGGFYYDYAEFPLKESTLDALRAYRFPDPDDPGRWRGLGDRARRLYAETPYAIVGSALFGGGIFEHPARFHGMQDWLIDLVANQQFADVVLGEVAERYAQAYRNFFAAVGETVQVVTYWDDLSSQNTAMISPELYRRLVKPRQRMIFDTIKSLSKAKIFYHNCGAVAEFIPDLIDIGVDILNPVQVSAKGMDTARLKREFGQHITFWGGAVDTQRVLPFGTPQEVREEAKQRITDLAPGGGFVYASIHNIQAQVPPENIVAMIEAWREFGSYR